MKIGLKTKTNQLGLTREDYRGNKSTLCPGCGHDSVSNQIISAAYAMGLRQDRIVKIGGQGCAGKSPAYMLGQSPSITTLPGAGLHSGTGISLSDIDLLIVDIAGDEDIADKGLTWFKHLIRRNVNLTIIIEDNGVHASEKGQFSATADQGQVLMYYGRNLLPPINLCLEAIVCGATFVARGFSGDAKQLQILVMAAVKHRGTSVIHVISPCIVFNNGPSSTKSYDYGKEYEIPLHEITLYEKDFDFDNDGSAFGDEKDPAWKARPIELPLPDGTLLSMNSSDREYDPRNRALAISTLLSADHRQDLITGLIYYGEERPTLQTTLDLTDRGLNELPACVSCPTPEDLKDILKKFT